MRRKESERRDARLLRQADWSLRRIANELGVSLSSVSVWVQDLPKPRAGLNPRPAHSARRPRPEEPTKPEPVGTRYCSRCETTLPLTEFNRDGDDFQWWCRECFRSYFRERGQLHRDQCVAGKRRRAKRAVAFLDQFLLSKACMDCGEDDSDVLECDHVGTKRHHVSWLAGNGCSIDVLRDEISQCEVVCVNCHRRRTAQRTRSWRFTRSLEPGCNAAGPQREAIRFVRQYLMKANCVDCGSDDLSALDFDHIGTKTDRVMKLARDGYSLARVQAEISECKVRCANCHRRRTRRQLGHRLRPSKLSTPP